MTPLRFSARDVSLDEVLDQASGTYVEITKSGTVKGIIVDPEIFNSMLKYSRKAIDVADISDAVFDKIMQSEPKDCGYSLDDLPEEGHNHASR